MRTKTAMLALLGTAMLFGCASHEAYRTNVVNPWLDKTQCPADRNGNTDAGCDNRTPELVDGKYELHYVEFDDQGWLHPEPATASDATAASPSDAAPGAGVDHSAQQIDALMDDLKQHLRAKTDLKVIVFVHGWKHSAQSDDDNVMKFRRLLERAASDELYQSAKRQVIGIYVGWRGKPWLVPDPGLDLSFWSRKDAASRVSTGSVRELFARLRSMQRYFNLQALGEHRRPAMRTLMIGHSFGGLILYAATSGPLIESLTAQSDLAGLPPLHSGGNESKDRAAEAQAERVADLIVLVNPAFEASRFEALYRVANRQQHKCYVPPVLVSITSETDLATGMAFPAGRFLNTLFERPASSSDQATAIKRTPGNMDRYVTHVLHGPASEATGAGAQNALPAANAVCEGWKPGSALLTLTNQDLEQAVKDNKTREVKQSQDFIAGLNASATFPATWKRTFCGGATLEVNQQEGENNAQTLVWNIRAEPSIINGHGDVMNPALLDVVRQMFGDTDLPGNQTDQPDQPRQPPPPQECEKG
ncbi:hypothetical protein [Burkholderia sp. S171]|uniref:hypothetical protein n=1 Tax=Burkholderia sp. S171 TaxID=1641860 RepID=UPI00131B005B|nr:hypothetical protein [Burkholderia sp. S171]